MAVATSTGVSFELTDDQKNFKEAAHEFAKNVIRPVAAEADQQSKLPITVLDQGFEAGLMNLHVPEEYGGLGLGAFEGVLVMEELA